MIGKITGTIDYCFRDHLLIDVGGVGYTVYISEKTLALLPKPGNQVALFTELVVREELLQLIGFVTLVEKEWYRMLTSVQGVGSKAALAILGLLTPQALSRAITIGDVATIKSAQGIGPKIAQRVVLELKEKVLDLMSLHSQGHFVTLENTETKDSHVLIENVELTSEPVINPGSGQIQSQMRTELDAISALVNLGYTQIDASTVVAKELSYLGHEIDISILIQACLKKIALKGQK
jgi:Holliday junction DNA helicase RuvA